MPPGVVLVKVGSTSVSVARDMSAASPGPEPSTRNVCSRWRSPPTRTHTPTTPLQMIITAA